MRLLVAEKPSMARAIADALGVKGGGKSFMEDKAKGIIIAWARGHLVEQIDPDEYKPEWKDWSWSTLPMIPEVFKGKVIKDTADLYKGIKELAARPDVTELVCATDAGREGELIFSLVYEQMKCKKPVVRLWTSSLTESAIQEAYKAMKPWKTYRGLTDAAHCRSEADWIVGMSGTRSTSLYARAKGREEKGAWNVGRVVTPTLAILVRRELEIRNFKPKDYFVVQGTFKHAETDYVGKWFKGEQTSFPDAASAKALVVKVTGKPAKIVKADTKPELKAPEQLYHLTAIQREANKRFGYSAERVLELVQSLYEGKVVSYPRTNSRHLTQKDAEKIPEWLDALEKISEYKPFVLKARANGLKLGKRFVDDAEVEDHTALVPTEKPANLGSLSGEERNIYDLIVRRFLGAFFPSMELAKSTIITEAEGETFVSRGTVVVKAGWSEVDAPSQAKRAKAKKGKDAEEDGEDEGRLPNVAGALPAPVKNLKVEASAKKTKPPSRMTEADLLGFMETAGKDLDDEELKGAMKDSGLGTPATRAATIEKLLDAGSKKYPKSPLAMREGKAIVPTDKGITLIQLIPVEALKSPELTGQWEAGLEKVRRNELTRAEFMKAVHKYAEDLVTEMKNDAGGAGESGGAVVTGAVVQCFKCEKEMAVRSGQFGPYVKCSCGVTYSTEPDGTPLGGFHEGPCGGPVDLTKNKKKKCKKCDQWLNGGGASIPCPKCEAPLEVRSFENRFYVKCSDACGVTFPTDEAGKPVGGVCAQPGCGKPMNITRSGKTICSVCKTWGPDDPATVVTVPCPKCEKPMGVRKFEGQHYVKCSCGVSYGTDAKGKATEGRCPKKECGGPVKKTQSGKKVCTKCDQWLNDDEKGPKK